MPKMKMPESVTLIHHDRDAYRPDGDGNFDAKQAAVAALLGLGCVLVPEEAAELVVRATESGDIPEGGEIVVSGADDISDPNATVGDVPVE